ncbi:MAG TPA: SGNH/GDSL hydrolase family protein, partial [Blastocatellia bacterium]|nr:SGNH/GDSL hydrolase family protein [Blastocatellia bacterium]
MNPRGWAQFLVIDELLGWHLAPNISAYYAYDEHTGEDLIVTDDNGFSADVNQQPRLSPEKSADVYRVIVLGGSTVMGEGAGLPSQNIVGMLRKGVRERGLTGPGGRRVELINAGVDAYNSAQEYLYFVSSLRRFKPDLVIAYDGWNDIDTSNFSVPPFRTGTHREIARRARRSYLIAGAVFFVAENLRYALTEGDLKLGTLELPWRMLGKFSATDGVNVSSPLSFDPRSIEYYRDNHRAFLALADEQLSVALFLQPLAGTARELSEEEKASWWYPRLRDDGLKAR